ncbi:hypothetical protein, partial [Thiolapillus sp.]|uniref:hypothetical protein n=1 Tax=Thiolapillus sp. TaxID=2017437 RepID=UPI003AF4D1E3
MADVGRPMLVNGPLINKRQDAKRENKSQSHAGHAQPVIGKSCQPLHVRIFITRMRTGGGFRRLQRNASVAFLPGQGDSYLFRINAFKRLQQPAVIY